MTGPTVAAPDDDTGARFPRQRGWYVDRGRRRDVAVSVVETLVWAPAEHALALVVAITDALDAPFALRLTDRRTGAAWHAAAVSAQQWRDALLPHLPVLAYHRGVEIVCHTDEDQLTVTDELLLVISSRTDRWRHRLDALGVPRRRTLPPLPWTPSSAPWRPSDDLGRALASIVAEVPLTRVEGDASSP